MCSSNPGRSRWVIAFLMRPRDTLMSGYIASAAASSQIAKYARPRQRLWMQAIQTRTGAISELLASMKGVKMLGLESRISRRVQGLREKELEISKRYRKVQISNIVMGIYTTSSSINAFRLWFADIHALSSSRKFPSPAVACYHIYRLWHHRQCFWKQCTRRRNYIFCLVVIINSHRSSE